MKTVSLSGVSRAHVGKKDAKSLRREGQVPCVVYGGKDQFHIAVKAIDLQKLIYTPDVYQIELKVGKDTYKVIIQEMQFHPVTDEPLHIDFVQLFDDKPVKINLPIRLDGNAIGVRNGGRLSRPLRRIACKGLPGDFPDAINIDIEKLKIGQSIRVKDVSFPGIELLQEDHAILVAIKTARGAVEEGEEGEEEEAGVEGAEAPAEETAE